MFIRRLASGLLLSAVLAATGCFHHGEKCHEAPKACCPPPGGVVPAPAAVPAPPPGTGFYYGPAAYGR